MSHSDRISLTRHLLEEQRAGHINPDLRLLMEVAARACKRISVAVGKGALGGVLGDAGTGNVQGEAQKKLDVIANDVLLDANGIAVAEDTVDAAKRALDSAEPAAPMLMLKMARGNLAAVVRRQAARSDAFAARAA